MHSQTRFANDQFLRFVQHVFGFFSELRGWSAFLFPLCARTGFMHIFLYIIYRIYTALTTRNNISFFLQGHMQFYRER